MKTRYIRRTFSVPACTKRLDFGPVTTRVATSTGCCPRTARSEGTKLAWTTQEHKSSSTLVTDRKETSSGSTMIRWDPKNNIDLLILCLRTGLWSPIYDDCQAHGVLCQRRAKPTIIMDVFQTKTLKHPLSGKCLAVTEGEGKDMVMERCEALEKRQRWTFGRMGGIKHWTA